MSASTTRRQWRRTRTATVIALGLCAVATSACSSSTDDAGAPTTTAPPGGSASGTAASVGELEELQLRPVLALLPQDSGVGTTPLTDEDGNEYLLAEPIGSTPVEEARVVLNPSIEEWTIEVTFTPEGLAVINELAAACVALQTTCPTGKVAMVIGDTVISAPSIQAPSLSNPVVISGTFDEAGARRLAALIRTAG